VDVLAFHDRLTTWGWVAPEPLAVCEAEVELVVKNEILADAVPLAVGAKVTVNGRLWPAGMVVGNVTPLTVKAELLELADDKVTLPPLALTLPFCVWVLPMFTLPKFKADGLTARLPTEVVPAPVSATATDGSEASELSMRVALLVPLLAGVNVTDRLTLLPAPRL
jgi:hypothetical protein